MSEEKRYDVFLSHNSDDKPLVEELALRLQDEAGLNPWLDAWHIPGGAQWEQEIDQALGSCRTCAVILGEHGWGEYHLRESRAALARREEYPSFRVIPVFLPGAREEDTDELPDFFAETQWIDFREGLDDTDALARLVAAIRGEVPYPEGRPSLSYLIRRDARRWEQTRRQDESLLYRGDELRRVQLWASQHPEEMNALAWEFLQASADLEEQQRAAQERRRRQTILGLAVGLMVTLMLALLAWGQRDAALDAQATAVAEANVRATAQIQAEEEAAARATAQAQAERQALAARSRELANAAIANLEIDPERSLLLAIEAIRTAYNPGTEDALRWAIFASQVRATLRVHGRRGQYHGGGGASVGIDMVSFSPDGKLLVTAGNGSTARIWTVPDGLETVVLKGHTGNVVTAVFSPDGRRIVTASLDDTARVWDATTGQVISILQGHKADVKMAVFSPDGQRVVTASEDGTSILWDAATGNPICILQGHEGEVNAAAFSPDGLRVVTASEDSTARVWQTSTCEEELILKGHTGGVTKAIYSPDGQRIATGSIDMSARIWDAQSGAEIHLLSAHFGGIYDINFSPDGTWLVTCGIDDTARVWDVSTGNQINVLLGHEAAVPSAVFSSDGQWIVTSGLHDNTARVWEATTGKAIAVLRGHTARVNYAAISPGGRWVATASEDGTARIWSTLAYEVGLFPGYAGRSHRIAFSKDQERLATVEAHRFDTSGRFVSQEASKVWIWDITTGNLITTLGGYNSDVEAIHFSPDAQWLATGHYATGMIRIWETASGRKVTEWKANDSTVSGLIFTPDSRWLISAGTDGSIHAWETSTWEEIFMLQGQQPQKVNIVLSPDGRWLVGMFQDACSLRIWDTTNWSEVAVPTAYTGSDNVWNYHHISFSTDSRWLALVHLVSRSGGGDASPLQVWDTASWTIAYNYRGNQPIDNVYFSPDCRWVVFNDDNDVKVVETETWRDVAVLKGHDEDLSDVDFSADMQKIVTSSYDRTARVWDVATGQIIANISGHEDSVFDASFSPDGQRVVTTSEDGAVRLWKATTGELIADLRGYSGSAYDAWFSPDGRRIITLGSGEVRIYAGTLEDLLKLAVSRVTRDFTCEERAEYLHEDLNCEEMP